MGQKDLWLESFLFQILKFSFEISKVFFFVSDVIRVVGRRFVGREKTTAGDGFVRKSCGGSGKFDGHKF